MNENAGVCILQHAPVFLCSRQECVRRIEVREAAHVKYQLDAAWQTANKKRKSAPGHVVMPAGAAPLLSLV